MDACLALGQSTVLELCNTLGLEHLLAYFGAVLIKHQLEVERRRTVEGAQVDHSRRLSVLGFAPAAKVFKHRIVLLILLSQILHL